MDQPLDLRIQKTYLSLKTAFAALLEEKRFEDITVNELCQRAMLRRTTFYKHFEDKYAFFAFFIRELAGSFRDQLPPDVIDGEVGNYFMQMSQELVRFSHLHEKMVFNIVRSSMFPLLLGILLEEITEDVTLALRRASPSLAQTPGKLKAMGAFYAGGILSTFLYGLKKDSPITEEVFLEIAREYAGTICL